MKFYLGVTDTNWFNYMSRLYNPEDINFWQPGGAGDKFSADFFEMA